MKREMRTGFSTIINVIFEEDLLLFMTVLMSNKAMVCVPFTGVSFGMSGKLRTGLSSLE